MDTVTLEQLQMRAQELADEIAKTGPQDHATIITLDGPLGAGKTTFVQAFAQALGIDEYVTSPTFLVLKSYSIPNGSFKDLLHVDTYRMQDVKDIESLGFNEILKNPNNIVVIEWPDKIAELLPVKRATIELQHADENTRKININ